MSRRGRSGPTISLFSFQDIITSVTAIVTVVALLLALDLIQRKQSSASDSSSSLAAELVARLQRAEQELAQLQAASATTDDLIRDVAATSPADLRNEIAAREASIAELKGEKARLELQHETWKDREQQSLVEQFECEPVRNELERTADEITQLEREQAEEQAENRTVFSLPKGSKRRGWVVEVAAKRISIALMGQHTVPTRFKADGVLVIGLTAAGHFEKWIAARNTDTEYFLILIRPDGASEFSQVQSMLERRHISYGFDLVDAERTVLHPEKGAAP